MPRLMASSLRRDASFCFGVGSGGEDLTIVNKEAQAAAKETRMKTRKTWTIIHTDEVTVRKSLSGYAVYCPRCRRLKRTVEFSEAVLLQGGSAELFNDLLNADVVHFAGDPLGGLICLDSLLAAPAAELPVEKKN